MLVALCIAILCPIASMALGYLLGGCVNTRGRQLALSITAFVAMIGSSLISPHALALYVGYNCGLVFLMGMVVRALLNPNSPSR